MVSPAQEESAEIISTLKGIRNGIAILVVLGVIWYFSWFISLNV